MLDHITLMITPEMFKELNEKWKQYGYPSRSEFIRVAIRDLLKYHRSLENER